MNTWELKARPYANNTIKFGNGENIVLANPITWSWPEDNKISTIEIKNEIQD